MEGGEKREKYLIFFFFYNLSSNLFDCLFRPNLFFHFSPNLTKKSSFDLNPNGST